jgi:hypothetical protein
MHTRKHFLERLYVGDETITVFSSGGTLHTVEVRGENSVVKKSFDGYQKAKQWIEIYITKSAGRIA